MQQTKSKFHSEVVFSGTLYRLREQLTRERKKTSHLNAPLWGICLSVDNDETEVNLIVDFFDGSTCILLWIGWPRLASPSVKKDSLLSLLFIRIKYIFNVNRDIVFEKQMLFLLVFFFGGCQWAVPFIKLFCAISLTHTSIEIYGATVWD